jgi:hypothetical protein
LAASQSITAPCISTSVTEKLVVQDNLPLPEVADQPFTTAHDAAVSFLVWAKQNRLLSKGPVDDAVEEDVDLDLQPQQMFESQTVKAVLRKRAVNLVVFNEAEKKVVVFTHARLTNAERKMMPFQFSAGIRVEYAVGGTAYVRGNAPPPDAYSPYTLLEGRICCGSSIHPVNCMGAGTFGAIVRDESGKLYGLTNNHVSGACNLAAPGLPILCPGPLDATEESISPFTIGRHSRLLPISEGIPENIDVSGNVDAAIFELEPDDQVCSMQGDKYDTPASVAEAQGGWRVEKVGRTTGFTCGTVVGVVPSAMGVAYSVKEYGVSKTVFFNDVIVVAGENGQPFSKGGDSGSLVVGYDEQGNRHAIGLVFAGNEARGQSFIVPLPVVLDKLGVELVSGLNV